LFKCDEHDDVPRTNPHERWNEPANTVTSTQPFYPAGTQRLLSKGLSKRLDSVWNRFRVFVY